MVEAICRSCGETFNPHLPEDRIPELDGWARGQAVLHYAKHGGSEPCDGIGVILGEWVK